MVDFKLGFALILFLCPCTLPSLDKNTTLVAAVAISVLFLDTLAAVPVLFLVTPGAAEADELKAGALAEDLQCS